MTRIVAVSLKMYFDRARTLDYCESVARIARDSSAVQNGAVRLAVLPDHLTLAAASGIVGESGTMLGAQDLCQEDRGAFTGEVSGADIAELGARVVEVGHAERRTIYKEDDAMVAAKTSAALRNGLIPLLCIGEAERAEDPTHAAAACAAQVRSAVGEEGTDAEVWLAYEPYWAIGAPAPAPAGYVRAVCDALRGEVAELLPNASLVYGGSAGPGLLAELHPSVDGLFLGRFAHDPAALAQVVEDASTL